MSVKLEQIGIKVEKTTCINMIITRINSKDYKTLRKWNFYVNTKKTFM